MHNLLERDKKYIWHPFTQLVDGFEHIGIESAKGAYLHTHQGRAIYDAISSWWVNLHGHSNPVIADAIAKQAKTLEHVMFAGFTHEPAVKLAENLLSILPDNQDKVFYSDDGSTAVEVALKMAIQYWHNQGVEKKKIIAMDGGYHGDTFGAMSVGERGPFTASFTPYLFQVEFIDFPFPEEEDKCLHQFKRLAADGQTAAFIYEPLVQGASGMRMYHPKVLDELLQLAADNDIICIADEVMTGFGRTGRLFASDYLKHKPDIICLSKGLTGGTMALGATSCTAKMQEPFKSAEIMKTFFHGHSYTANPLACAAANASYEMLVTGDCESRIEAITAYQQEFRERIKGHESLHDTRMLGTILALELETEDDTHYVNELRSKLYPFFLERDVLIRPLGNVVYVLPPYVSQKEDLDKAYGAIEEMLDNIKAG